ncbi:MAG: branched-chain-amino-acid transaminase, partial [Elusimicrobia bacterium]|nr:branched-chain-amino-acid transaminase [Elusimicrobiota bacterium]
MKIYIDGRYHEKDEAKISVFDHGLLYGDGIFEGIRAYNGRVFMLKEHLARLLNSARGIFMDLPWSREEIREIILETLRTNSQKDAYIRVVITRGTGDLGLDMRKCKRPTLIVITDKIELYPDSFYKKGLEVITSSFRRTPHDSLSPSIKSLNYLNNILAKNEAVRAGAGEAIMLNHEGYVAEGSGDNVFFLKDGKWFTPPVSAGILEGVTRMVVAKLIPEKFKMPVVEELFTMFQLYQAEEVFLTGTGAEIIPAVKIDGRVIGSGQAGPFTQKIITAFREFTQKTGTTIFEAVKTGDRGQGLGV